MKTKSRDVKYCDVREDIIKSANLLEDLDYSRVCMLYEYITERYKIHLRKDIMNLEPPYTKDDILLNYKFTNVRREHDRTTRWLIENISHNDIISYVDKIYKTIIFRLFNRIETAELLHLDDEDFFVPEIYSDRQFDWLDKCRNQISKVDPNYRFFTNAYKTGGTTVGLRVLYPKEKVKFMRPLLLVNDLIKDNFAVKLSTCENQKQVFNLLQSIKGVGSFIAYQIYVDLTYIEDFPFSENEFVVAGPGCKYGIELLFRNRGKSVLKEMTHEEVLFWIRDNMKSIFDYGDLTYDPEELFSDLPEYDRYINIMSLENIFCEFQKYVRATSPNMSNPRNRYKPYKHEDPFKKGE